MTERPHSRYTREKTWAALYSQHINAGYALVPWSTTNNSIAVIRCGSAKDTKDMMDKLLQHERECAAFYETKQTPDKAPDFLKKARHAVILARSSDYYHYHLADHPEFALVICGLHDSYLHLPVWEMKTNHRYDARTTAVPISSPDFAHIRSTQFGHNMLVGALINGDKTALVFLKSLPERTRHRIASEVEEMQETRYRGRPLAFLTDAERQAIGSKISASLKRHHEQKRLRIV